MRRPRRNSSRSFRRDHGIGNDIGFRRAEDFCEIESTDVPNQRGERRLEKVHSPRAWGCHGDRRGLGQEDVHAAVCGDRGCDEQGHGCGWKGTFPEPGSLSSGVTEQVAGGSEAPRVGVGGVWAPGGGSGWARPLLASGYQECQLLCGFAEVSVRTRSLRMTETALLVCLL